jgi:pyocin large subunit-like protein
MMSSPSDYGGGNTYPVEPTPENVAKWNKGTYNSAKESLIDHFKRHGSEVGAKDVDQYVRKAKGFYDRRKGAKISYPKDGTFGAIRYTKNGKYIIMAPDKTIISFGLENRGD